VTWPRGEPLPLSEIARVLSYEAYRNGLPVPVLDALVRSWIERNLVPGIARAVIQAEPKMRTEVVRNIPRIVKKEPLLTQPDIDEDWAWAR
jgi:hypothetical protein